MRFASTREIIRECICRLSASERAVFYVAAVLFTVSGSVLAIWFTATHTTRLPANGGTLTEAIVGGPRFINPVLAPANDTDRDIVSLVFSGLIRQNENGNIVPDLAESYQVATDAKTFIFTLREGLAWHDGTPLTAEDVAFTIRLLQNPEYQSPLRFGWQGVRVEERDDRTIAFVLQTPYAQFISHATVGILPKHLWQNIPAQAFALDDLNLKPVGSGPFKFKSITREKDNRVSSITLARNAAYYFRPPYLDAVTYLFYENRDDALLAANDGTAEAFGGLLPAELAQFKRSSVHAFSLPRIFGVFFNQTQTEVLADKVVREALTYATDRARIASDVYAGNAEILEGPLPSSVFGFSKNEPSRIFDRDRAMAILTNAGWKTGNDGVRRRIQIKKEEQVEGRKKVLRDVTVTTTLAFTLLTANLPDLEKTANLLAEMWRSVGVDVSVEVTGVADIQGERVRPRQYEAVLFGQVYGLDPDPYSFWHSSQRHDPGLNLALYQNPKVDRLLEDIRQTGDPVERGKKLAEFQNAVSNDNPTIFLVSPRYLYSTDGTYRDIANGVIANPSARYISVADWYVKTKRVWR